MGHSSRSFSPLSHRSRDPIREVSTEFPQRRIDVRVEVAQPGPTRSSRGNSSTNSNSNGRSGGNTSGTLYRIMIAAPYSDFGRLPNCPLLNRIRVPPMVAMQYEMSDPATRMSYSHWLLASGINTGRLTSDVLMGIYLNIRQVSTRFGVDGVLPQNNEKQWQNCFNNVAPGLALIPPSLRHGELPSDDNLHYQPRRCHHRRRRPSRSWVCVNHKGTSTHLGRLCNLSRAGSSTNSAGRPRTDNHDNSQSQEDPGPSTSRSASRINPPNTVEESSTSSSSISSSGYSSSSSEAVCLRTVVKREAERHHSRQSES